MQRTTVPAYETAAASGAQACVVDARLVLSRLGLLTVTRLSAGFSVWLPRELREILRDTRSFLDDPDRLMPRVYCASMRNLDAMSDRDAIAQELSQWDCLPENDDLAALPMHYIGERADESVTPLWADRGLRERYDQLLGGLELKMRESGYDLPRGEAFAACTLDAVALCAALQPYRSFVLTRLESDAWGAPALCNYLDAWEVKTSEVPQDRAASFGALRESVARAGLGPVGLAGVPLAAVHVLLPGFPVLGGRDKGMDDEEVSRLWSRAAVFWHRI